MAAKVLIVESDATLAFVIGYNLASEGIDVTQAAGADEALSVLSRAKIDLCIIGRDDAGRAPNAVWNILAAADENEELPPGLIMVSPGEKRIAPLPAGVDVIVRPFSMVEFVSRAMTLMRRSADTLAVDGLLLNREARYVARHGRELRLGPTEYRLLALMMEHPGRVFSRSELRTQIWGEGVDVEERTIDVHIGRLRKALNRGREPDPIRTVRGAGYALAPSLGMRGRRNKTGASSPSG
jgi:two-component system phosphate regulon response regulator PhoB